LKREGQVCAFVAVFVSALVAGCGGSTQTSVQTATSTTSEVASGASEHFTNSNWAMLAADPESHKGATVSFVAKVFTTPERDAKGVYLQVWADPQNSEQNTIVGYADPSFVVSDDDYVRVSGVVKGAYSGENAFGGKISATLILADTVKVVGALAARPTTIAALGSATYTQGGVTVTIRRVEFAAPETRVFMTVRNGSGADVTVYDSSMRAVQAGRQYDNKFSMEDYPELSDDLVPGATTSGVVVFPRMNPHGNLRLYVEVSSEDYNVGDYGTLKYTFTWS
jgi:hypothetical protein